MFQWPEEIPREEYTRLYSLERNLRRLVIDQLSKITDKWWRQRIPKDIREEAEERKRREEQTPYPGPNLHPVWYIDFSHYVKIITKRDNWKEAFEPIFKNKEHIKVWLEGLAQIRNKIAHMRPLGPREKVNLDALSQDILVCIWKYTCDPYIRPAKKYMQEEKYQEAEKILLEGFKKTQRDPWIAYHLGELYEAMERLEEGEKQFEYAEKHLVLSRYKKRAKEKLLQIQAKIKLGKMHICPKCGSETPKEYSFCGKCGHEF